MLLPVLAYLAADPQARETDTPPPTEQRSDTLAPIIVTAERREADQQRVPVSVTAIPTERIEAEDMRGLDRIATSVPNLYLNRNFGTTSGALIFLRGVGEGDSIFTNDPPVGVYVDDVLYPRSTASLFDFLDLERIEVLRGPQGTLYGRNTSGGAIKLVTRAPDLTRTEGVADVTVGSYRRFDVRGTLNLPITSDLALRVSGISRLQRGWGHNLTNGDHVNGQDVQGGRFALLWQPSDALSVTLRGDFADEGSAPRYPQRFLPDPQRPGRYLPVFAEPDGDIDNFTSPDTLPLNDTRTGGASLTVRYRTGKLNLSSITAWRALHNAIGFDQTANPPGQTNVILLQDQNQHTISQEFQLGLGDAEDRWSLTAGLFGFWEHNDQLTAISLAGPDGRYHNEDFFTYPSRSGGPTGNWSPYLPQLDTRSASAYASLSWRPVQALSLSAGLRFTDEIKTYRVRFLSGPGVTYVLPDGRLAARTIHDHWSDVSPRFALDYQLKGKGFEAMIFASASKGFRSGSFDGRARNIDFVLTRQGPIAPETVWSYEVGVKSEWLDHRLRANATFFRNDYTNIAFSAARANSTPPEIFRQNVGDARISGVELELTARPVSRLELSGLVSTLSDKFTRLAASPGCTAFVADERDLDLRFTPDVRYTMRGAYTLPVAGGRLRLGGEYSAASPYSIALCNEPQHRVDNYELVNAQIGFETGDGRWGVTLSATNLTDRRFNTGSVGTIGYPADPRQVQISLRRAF